MNMSHSDQRWLLEVFKVLADENRLRILALVSQQEHNVGGLAAALGIKEPTTSHHLSKLRGVGLINLRTDGTQRFYRLDVQTLDKFKAFTNKVETISAADLPASDNSWIDALGFEDWERKVLQDSTRNGRLTQIPPKFKKLMVILRWLATKFDRGVDYTEKEVNAILMQYHEDFVSLRRNLIEAGLLRREPSGARYWVPTLE